MYPHSPSWINIGNCKCYEDCIAHLNKETMIKILITVIAWSVLVSSQGTGSPFPCHSDVCNLYGQDQFCSKRESKCRDCLDIIDGCFEPGTPSNCTRTCIEFHVQEKLKKERESACPNLDPIENGKNNGSTLEIYKPGDVVGITCDAGYRLSGRPSLKCKSYGQWSHDVPTCEEITCPVLQGVSNGNHNGSETIPQQPGDVIIFQCNHGYQRIGQESTTCRTDGTWQDKMPICQIYPELPPIMNGKWNQSELVLHATCDSGYILVGSEFLRWSETGSWVSSDGHLPYCKEEEITVTVWMIFSIVECVCICCYIVYRCCMYVYSRKNKDNTIVSKTPKKTPKECGNKEEASVFIEAEKEPQSENTFPTLAVSLHEQKYQKEATSISNGIKKDDRALEVTRSKGIAPSSTDHFSSQTHNANISIDPPDMPSWSNSVPKDHRVLQDVKKKKQEAASENNIPSNTQFSCPGKHDDKSNHVKIDINIHNNSSAHNKSVVDSGRDATPSKSTNTTAPSTADGQMVNTRMDDLKLPVEESATCQPSQPESAAPDTEASTVLKEVNEQHGTYGTANMNGDSCAASRPLNGLAIQQNANNEQDIARKLGLANGNVNTDDLENHEVTKF